MMDIPLFLLSNDTRGYVAELTRRMNDPVYAQMVEETIKLNEETEKRREWIKPYAINSVIVETPFHIIVTTEKISKKLDSLMTMDTLPLEITNWLHKYHRREELKQQVLDQLAIKYPDTKEDNLVFLDDTMTLLCRVICIVIMMKMTFCYMLVLPKVCQTEHVNTPLQKCGLETLEHFYPKNT